MTSAQTCLVVLLITAGVSTARADQECSQSSFAAYGYQWNGLPVMNAAETVYGSEEVCGFVVRSSVQATEEWYRRELESSGWKIASRKEMEGVVVLEISGQDKSTRIFVQRSQVGTVVLLHKLNAALLSPPNTTMEPTR